MTDAAATGRGGTSPVPPVPLLVSALTALLLVSCGGAGSAGPDSDAGSPDPSGSWELAAAQPTIEVPDDARVTLEVTADDSAWQVGGTAACNSYGGTVITDGGAWRGQDYEWTAMGCAEPRMRAERAYLEALQAVESWTRPSDDELVLSGPDHELRFEALAPAPTAELTGTTWVLDGLTSGGGPDASVSSPAAAAEEATLRLRADGTVRASTGCRAFAGEWTERGDEILLPTFGVRDDSPNVATDGDPDCDEAVIAQERQVLAVLGDGFRPELDGRSLTLTSRDGLGLTYRAADG